MNERLESAWERIVGYVQYLCRVILLSICMASLILIALDTLSYFFQSGDFTVQQITVEGNDRVDQDEILARASIAPGVNIWLVDLQRLSKRVEEHPAIRGASVQRVPPHRVHIRVEERAPVAFLMHPEDGQLYGVDYEGIILEPFMGPTFPRRDPMEQQAHLELALTTPLLSGTFDIDIRAGETVKDPRVLSSLVFIQEMRSRTPDWYREIAELEWREDGALALHPYRRIGVVILQDIKSPSLVDKLAAFWRVIERENLRAVYVDARFPSHGFAVRWDEQEGESWKRLYPNPSALTMAGRSE